MCTDKGGMISRDSLAQFNKMMRLFSCHHFFCLLKWVCGAVLTGFLLARSHFEAWVLEIFASVGSEAALTQVLLELVAI